MLACRPNIGPLQRRRRLRLGAAAAAAAVVLAAALAAAAAPALLRATVALPLTLAAYGFFQYREKT
ncbi:MAG TPA: hypothetical protein VMN60_05895 [Longimicrobiales bacterium]|nr:hypothetical protein [Longimicrobiales bacterium]